MIKYDTQYHSVRRCAEDPGGRLSADGTTYEAADGETNMVRYANHAVGDRANFRLVRAFTLVSKRRLAAGEEVLFNYGRGYGFL